MHSFTYTNEQAMSVGLVGLRRSVSSILKGRKDGVVAKDRGIEIHLEGAWAEGAFAHLFGLPLELTLDTFRAPDLGTNLQIRSTKYNTGRLLVKEQDSPEHIYVLVCGEFPTYTVVGYIEGHEAKKAQYWGTLNSRYSGPQCYIIPQERLSRDWENIGLLG